MHRTAHLLVSFATVATAALWAPVASAEPTEATVTVAQPEKNSLFGGAAVEAEQLGAQRGGDLQIINASTKNTNNLTGTFSGGDAGLSSGQNYISHGAFANAAGIPVVMQNTGNNVLLQQSTIVNLQVK